MRKILKAIGIIFIVLILFLTFYSIVATVSKNNVSIPRSEETKPSATEQIFIPVPRYCSIGDTVTLNGVKVTLVNAFKVKPNNSMSFLLGAGTSVSSGIMSGGQMVWDFKRSIVCTEKNLKTDLCID